MLTRKAALVAHHEKARDRKLRLGGQLLAQPNERQRAMGRLLMNQAREKDRQIEKLRGRA